MITLNASQFQISYAGGDGNDIVLTCVLAAKTWTGAVDDQWSTPGNWAGGVPGAGDVLLFPSGAAHTTNTNDLAAGTVFDSLTFTGGGYVIGGNTIGLTNGISGGATINAALQLAASQTIQSSILNGPIDLGSDDLTLDNVQVNGVISGSGGVIFPGGFTTLTADNLYTGPTTLAGGGPLTINGTQPSSPVTVPSGHPALQGHGTVGTVTTTGGSLELQPTGAVEVLNTGAVSVISGELVVRLNGPVAGADYGQLNVTGTVTLGAGFGLSLSLGFTPARGQVFTIVRNDGTDAVSGTFNGWPEGTTFTIAPYPYQFKISYLGKSGTDNDVVLVSLDGSSDHAPVAVDDGYDASPDVQLSVPATGVLFNDSDPDPDVLTVIGFSPVSAKGGTVNVNADGSFTYTPAPAFTGADTFTYTISDGQGGTDTATVTITVTAATPTPTSTATPIATPTETPTATPLPLDHFQCYASYLRPLNNEGVTADDQFGPSVITVRRAKRLCAPVNKNGEDPTAPSHPGHLTSYTIKQTSPRFERIRDIKVTNQFGDLTVDLYRPDRLLVPTSKSLVGLPPPLTTPLDHYKCYRARGARFRKANITIQTQFGTETVAIKRPLHLCAPVDKNGEGILDPILHLMCYQVRTVPQRPLPIFTNNQFSQEGYQIFGVRELCVPSLKDRCGDGVLNNPPTEECDGTDAAACPGQCRADCTCPPPPTCGDGTVNQASEVTQAGPGSRRRCSERQYKAE